MSNIDQPKNHKKLILMLLLTVIIFTSLVMYFGVIKRQPLIYHPKEVKVNGVFLASTKTIEDFHLIDNKGKSFSKDNLKGRWTIMFFGFTNCGYVCPTTLTELNKMYKTLKNELPETQLPQVVLVSVDPERDSIERMNDYINAFNSNFIGARADLIETEALEKQLHISAIKMQVEGQGKDHYMVNHTAEIILFNPQAKIQAYLSFPHKAEQLVEDYKQIMGTTL